jgi:pimeloyl-ACP methyl ester carboxylesterase
MRWFFLLLAVNLGAATATLDGRKIFYRAEGPAKETLIFVHGWSANETFFLPQVEEFRKSHRVITLDLPGHGKSEMFQTFSMELCARAVEAVRLQEKAAHPVLIGHSMGALVIREYAKRYAGQARALVFLDGSIFRLPPDEAGREGWRQGFEAIAARFSPQLDKAVRERHMSQLLSSMYAENTPREFQLMILGQVLQTRPETSQGAMLAIADLANWDEKPLPQPTLFLRAGKQAPPGDEQFLRGLFPKLRYNFMPGVSHFLHLETPEAVNREIADFLRSLAK